MPVLKILIVSVSVIWNNFLSLLLNLLNTSFYYLIYVEIKFFEKTIFRNLNI